MGCTRWALACLASWFAAGLPFFGIPKTLYRDLEPPHPQRLPEHQPVPAGSSATTTAPRGPGAANTNLEQISDWLTKIIVGGALVQFQKLPETINRAAAFMSPSLGSEDEKYFAGGIIVFFSILGFLGSYLLTRIYLQPLLAQVDNGLPISEAQKDEIASAPVPVSDRRPTLTDGAAKAAKQVLGVPLSDLTVPKDILVWARSPACRGELCSGRTGYKKALELDPNNIDLIDYSVALQKTGSPLGVVKEQLLDAYKRLTPQTDKTVMDRLYDALTYTFAYMDPPDGFTNAIKYGEEYIANKSNLTDGGIYVTLAAAYGQQFKWLQDHPEPSVDAQTVRAKALEAANTAISIAPAWKENLAMLLDPTYPNKPAGENDLEVFKDDKEFRELLGLALQEESAK